MKKIAVFITFLGLVNFLAFDVAMCQTRLKSFSENDKWGFIDETGSVIIKPTFDDLNEFSDGLAWFSDSGKIGYLDIMGRKVFTPYAHYPFSEGLAPFFKDNKLGFINKKGEIAFYPGFKNYIIGSELTSWGVPEFSEGLASVLILKCDTCNWHNYIFINRNGVNEFGNKSFTNANNFSEGLAFVCFENDGCGYINHKGKLIIKMEKGESGERFSEGFAVVWNTTHGSYHYINKKGEWIINSSFERAEAFSDGMAQVSIGGKYGFINTTGEIVVKPIYCNASAFFEGIAFVTTCDYVNENRKYYTSIIDKTGKIRCGPYEDVSLNHCLNGIAVCTKFTPNKPDVEFYLNRTGKIIWSRIYPSPPDEFTPPNK